MSDSENSDASVTWEDFFDTTTTDLVPGLLGMFDALLERNPNTKHQKRLSGSSFHLQASTVRPKSPSPLLKQCLVTNTIAATAASQDRHQSLHQQQQYSRGVAGKSSAPGAQSNKSSSSLSLNANCDTVSSTPPTKKPFTRTQSGSTFISLSPNVKRILSNLDDRASPSCDDSVEKNVIIDQCDRDNVNRTHEVLVNRNVESIKSPFVRSKSVCNPNSVYSQKLVGVVRPQQQINNDENGSAGRLSQVSIKYETKTSVRKSDTDIHLKETSSAPSSAKSSPFWTKIGQKQFTTSSPIKNSRNSLFEFRSKAGSQDMLSFDKPEQRRSSSFIKMEYSSPVDETSLDDTSRIPKIEIIDRNSDDNSPNNSFDVSQADICQNKSNDLLQVPRPLSMTSITSSTSTSSASSGVPNKNNGNAYLASIESLDDDSDCDNNLSRHGSTRSSGERRDGEPEVGSQGSGDSGILANGGVVANAPGTAPRPRYCDPDLSPEERVLIEIYDTEAVYVSALREVIQGYLTLWEEDNNCILSNYIPDLFSNLKEIYEFNSVFLYQLQEVGPNAVNISKVFISNHDGFKIYTDYCTNYPKTMSVLTELMSNDITAKVFRDQQARLGHSLPLGSYLLKPVQRILKYHLLLQNLVKECNIEDVSDVKLALSTMTGIAHHINDMKRKHEHAVRVQEIQSLLYGWDGEDLTTFGELCVEGSFRMHGAKAQRHAFLFDKMLLLTKNREDGILSYKLHIMCSNLMLIESVQGEPLSFHVIPFDNPKMQCTLQARNLEQKREWTLQLKRVILENYNAVIPSHARQLVMELGQNKTDDDVPLEKSNSSKKPHSAPEYLQRRRIDRERRKSETGLRSRLRKSRKSEPSLESEQETTPFESGSILSGENSSPNMQIRNGHRDSSQSRDRSKSREPFMKFGSWRRKSEPGIEVDISNLSRSNEQEKAATLDRLSSNDYSTEFQIPHYNSKTLPKKIYKMKKAKNKNRSAKFYTDLSDAINNDEVLHISESNDDIHLEVDLTASNSQLDETPFENNLSGAEMEAQATLNISSNQNEIPETIEDIVSQLLMQNREFQKIFKKQKKQIGLRNRINKTSALNSKPKVDKENGSSDSEIDTSLESYDNLLNNSECQKNNLDKESTLMTKSNNIYSNEDYNIEEKNSQNKQRFSVESKCLAEEKQIYQNGGHLNNYRRKIFNSGSNSDAIKFESCQKNECIDKNLVQHDKDIYVNLKDDPFVATDSKINLQDKTCSDSLNNVESDCKIAYESINHIWQAINSPHTKHPLLLNTDEQSSPNTPEVWLKCQNEHMTIPKTRKSGSLPRSFELINEKLKSEFKYFSRDGKLLYNDRPLTIASESTTEIDFEDLITKKNFSEIQSVLTHSEAEMKKQRILGNAITDTSLERNCKKGITDYEPIYDVPNADQDVKNDSKMINLNFNIHPEYKIYRPCVNLTSFKNVFVKTSYRRTKSNDDEILCDLNDKEKKQTTVMKNYSRSLLQRFKSIVTEDGLFENSSDKQRNKETIDFNNFNSQTSGECTIGTNSKNSDELQTHFPLNVTWKFPNKNSQLPIYKQGSKSLGARIAQSDYANPHDLFQETGKENVLINKYSVRPDSLLSNSSHFTSSSDSCTGDDHDKLEKNNCSNDQIRQRFCSATGSDSFYEKTFEAIETIKDNDVFRDSAVYSDHDDLKINSEVCNKNLDNSKSQEIKPSISKVKCKYPQEIRFEKIQGRITKNHQIINRNIKGLEFTNEVNKMKNNFTSKKQMKRPNKLPPPVPLKPEFSTIALKSAKEITTLKTQIKDENTEIIKQITEICDTRPTSIVEKLQSLKVNSCLNDCDNGKFEIDKAIVQRRKDLQAMSVNSNTSKCNFNHKTNKNNFTNTSSNLNEDRSQLNVSKSNDLNDQYDNIATTNKSHKYNEHSREQNEAEIHRKLNKSADNLLLDKEQVNNDNFPVLCNNPSSSGWVKHVVGKFQ